MFGWSARCAFLLVLVCLQLPLAGSGGDPQVHRDLVTGRDRTASRVQRIRRQRVHLQQRHAPTGVHRPLRKHVGPADGRLYPRTRLTWHERTRDRRLPGAPVADLRHGHVDQRSGGRATGRTTLCRHPNRSPPCRRDPRPDQPLSSRSDDIDAVAWQELAQHVVAVHGGSLVEVINRHGARHLRRYQGCELLRLPAPVVVAVVRDRLAAAA